MNKVSSSQNDHLIQELLPRCKIQHVSVILLIIITLCGLNVATRMASKEHRKS